MLQLSRYCFVGCGIILALGILPPMTLNTFIVLGATTFLAGFGFSVAAEMGWDVRNPFIHVK